MTRREISAGGVVYRNGPAGTEVVLTRPKGRDAWALPKGLVETGETAERAAVRECREETGLSGTVTGKIDTIKYTYTAKWEDPPERVFKIVTFYLIEHSGGNIDEHDWEVEKVEWFPIHEAVRAASYRTEKAILQKAATLLNPAPKNQDR